MSRLNEPGRMRATIMAEEIARLAAELEQMVRYEHPFVQDQVHQIHIIARQLVTNLTVYAQEPSSSTLIIDRGKRA